MSTIFTLPNLIQAYYDCRHNKRRTINALKFEANLEDNLLPLLRQLQTHTYRPGRSICFVVTKPKIRETFAAQFADRIVHHVLINQIQPYFEARFIDQSFACRPGKGTHTALHALQKHVCQTTANGTRPCYYLQIDIDSFFMSINQHILFNILQKQIQNLNQPPAWKEEVPSLAKLIIFHQPTRNYGKKGDPSLFAQLPLHKSLFYAAAQTGLPIGNLTSQFFANVYLNQLDQFAKRQLKIRHYFRYVDDIVVLSENQEQLTEYQHQLDAFLQQHLKLKLHPDKQKLSSVYSGIDFVGYIISPTHTLVRRRVVKNFKAKVWELNQQIQQAQMKDSIAPLQNDTRGNPSSCHPDPELDSGEGSLAVMPSNRDSSALPQNDSYATSISERERERERESKTLSTKYTQLCTTVNSYFAHFCHANSFRLRSNLYYRFLARHHPHIQIDDSRRRLGPPQPPG